MLFPLQKEYLTRTIIKRGKSMKYYFNMYISEELVEKKAEILQKIENNQIQLNKYVIVLAKNEKNHLEFYDTALLRQDIFDKDSLFLIGLAEGYSGSAKMIEKITQEVLDESGGTDIRGYLLRKQKDFEERKV